LKCHHHSGEFVLTSNGIIESLFGKMTSLVGRIENLVVKDGEVEGKTKADWMRRSKVCLSNFGGSLVSFK